MDSSYPSVTVAGDDLLVLHAASMSAWRVSDIGSVLAEQAARAGRLAA